MQTTVRLTSTRPIADTLALMRSLVRARRGDARVRSAALSIVRDAPPHDSRERVRRILTWVRASMPYEKDPRDVEAINDPVLSLEKIHAYGQAAGDCDDAAVLISTLAEAVGVRTRLVAVSVRRDRVLHHVAVEAYDPIRDAWYTLDPYAPREVGDRMAITAALRTAI